MAFDADRLRVMVGVHPVFTDQVRRDLIAREQNRKDARVEEKERKEAAQPENVKSRVKATLTTMRGNPLA